MSELTGLDLRRAACEALGWVAENWSDGTSGWRSVDASCHNSSHMTVHDVIAKLKNAQGDKSLRTFAKEIKVDYAVLSKIYSGNRAPSPSVLRFLKLKKTIRTEYDSC